jgi:hypothetical protein
MKKSSESRVRFLLIVALFVLPPTASAQSPEGPNVSYVGSNACQNCHPAIYARWSKTRMANVVRDPKTHPEAILPDLTKPDPLVKFTRDDIAFVYGSKWKQRYFTKVDTTTGLSGFTSDWISKTFGSSKSTS